MNDCTFLGETPAYWLELQKRARCLDVTGLIRDLADATAKVAYYEKRIDEMMQFRTTIDQRKKEETP